MDCCASGKPAEIYHGCYVPYKKYVILRPVNLGSAMQARYMLGASWALVAYFISALNDFLGKDTGRLGGGEVLFFRFLFATLAFLPVLLVKGREMFRTSHIKTHALRGAFFAIAMLPWSYGLIDLPLPLMTAIGFSTPLFTVSLAYFVLKEPVGKHRVIATLIGFVGILIGAGFSMKGANGIVGLALLATFLFSSLDIINKRLLNVDEPLISMLFFSSLFGTLTLVVPMTVTAAVSSQGWVMPTLGEFAKLGVLGVGSNLILFCLLKAFKSCDVSALQPLRYFEFIFSCFFSIVFLGQWPTASVLWGMALLVPATFYLGRHELRLERSRVSLNNA